MVDFDSVKPNWKDIERYGIWKVLGVIECNYCDGQRKCWGTKIDLLPNPENKVTGKKGGN